MTVSRETEVALRRYVELLLDENTRQNLIAKTSEAEVWDRHIRDSLQLLDHAPDAVSWVDIGAGPGLPGMVIAIATGRPTTLVEPRALRVSFLERVRDALHLTNVSIVHGKAAHASGNFDAITARAVASASSLFAMTMHLSHSRTRWVLPKGRSVQSELEEVRRTWQGRFRVEPSVTDAEAGILIAEGVSARGKR